MSARNSSPAFAVGGAEPVSPWRYVDDELPRTDETVVVMCRFRGGKPGINIAYRASANTWVSGRFDDFDDDEWDYVTSVTHWMPLPAAPGKEAR